MSEKLYTCDRFNLAFTCDRCKMFFPLDYNKEQYKSIKRLDIKTRDGTRHYLGTYWKALEVICDQCFENNYVLDIHPDNLWRWYRKKNDE